MNAACGPQIIEKSEFASSGAPLAQIFDLNGQSASMIYEAIQELISLKLVIASPSAVDDKTASAMQHKCMLDVLQARILSVSPQAP